ncbi:MAG: hypothetical protein ACKOWC_02235 [Limnohabitans sp.]
MGIALLTFSNLFQGFSALQRLTTGSPAIEAPHRVRASRVVRPIGVRAQITPRPVSSICVPRPAALRVVRVCDAQQPGDVGRLVISGRMADVCAELDRLAEREAAATRH